MVPLIPASIGLLDARICEQRALQLGRRLQRCSFDSSSGILESRRVVISKVFNLPDLDNPASIAESEFAIDWIKDIISSYDDPTEPAAEMCYSIINDDEDGGKVVGVKY
jgi:hypothetical protein